MRAPMIAALILVSPLLASCADMPTAPRAVVGVSGAILDREGHGIQAVYVDFVDVGPRAEGTYPAYYHLVTDLTGTFSGSIPEGRYDVFLRPPAFSAYAPALLLSQEVGRPGLRLDHRFDYVRLAIRPSIAGGQPASALKARLWPDFSLGYVWDRDLRLAGDEREAFVPPGTYSLQLDLAGSGFGYLSKHLYDMAVTADTTIDVAFSGYAISIHVTEDGQPVANAPVHAAGRPGSVTTTADGTGTATLYLTAGTYYRIAVEAPSEEIMGRALGNVSITGDASFDFDLSGTVWTGVVRHASNGTPVAGAIVYASPGGPTYTHARSVADANGAFHLVVQRGLYHHIAAYQLVGTDAWGLVATIDSIPAGADSTFDIPAGVPQVPVIATTPALPAGPDAPASAAADPAFRRRSSRTGE